MISPFKGAMCLFRGLVLIHQPGLRRFVWIPLAVNLVLFTVGFGVGYLYLGVILAFFEGMLPFWLAWLSWILAPILFFVAIIVMFFSFTVVANLLAAPFNSLLSAEVEFLLSGERPLSSGPERQIRNELEKMFYFLKKAILLTLLFLVPGINALSPLLWFLFCVWMMAVEYGDYPMANYGMSGREVRQRLRRHWAGSLGFGGAITLMMMVPVLNFFAMPTAVAGAAVFWLEIKKEEGIR